MREDGQVRALLRQRQAGQHAPPPHEVIYLLLLPLILLLLLRYLKKFSEFSALIYCRFYCIY